MEQSPNLSLCPYLGSRQDRTTAYAYPTNDNRCYSPAAPNDPSPAYQASCCLVTVHTQCPFCVSAEEANLKSEKDLLPPILKTRSILATIEGWAQRTLVVGLGVIILLILGFAILPRLVAGELLDTGSPAAEPDVALRGQPIATPGMIQAVVISTATPALSKSPPRATAIIAREAEAATSTREPTTTPLPTLTAAPPATLPRATAATFSSSNKPSATPTPQATVTPTNTPLYAAPQLLEPPNGTLFKRNTILRWSSKHVLNQDEVFDVLVWPAGAAQQASIGNTMEQIFPIDFKSWSYTGHAGTFYWTIRIKGADGVYLSPASPPLSIVIE